MSKARQLADLGNVYDDGALSNRNLIINGAMQVAQRGTSFTGLTSNYTIDRFVMYQTSGFLDVSQDSDAPDGFRNSLKTTVNTANPSPASTDLTRIAYVVEAQDVARLNYGSASAQTLTLSFWVKSTVAADYTIFVYVDDPARSIVKGYTINSANTWEYKTITIAGDTGGTGINDDNGVGIYYEFNLMAGSTYSTAGAQDTWVSGGGTRASGQTANCATSGATWQITGVQLEVGDTATPFEHRSYGDELAKCMRYTTVFRGNGSGVGGMIAVGASTSASNSYFLMTPQVPMRATPSTSFSSLVVSDSVAFDAAVNTLAINYTTGKSFYVETAHSSNSSVGKPVNLRPSSGSFGELILDAEL